MSEGHYISAEGLLKDRTEPDGMTPNEMSYVASVAEWWAMQCKINGKEPPPDIFRAAIAGGYYLLNALLTGEAMRGADEDDTRH